MKKINKPELLCPVGGQEQLVAAVENGADAVYLGGADFNARIYADNFSTIESIEKAVDYAHLRNVKVYVTLNTLVNDNEFNEAIEYATKLYEIGVDALIIQDIGLVDIISKKLPDLKIHISTQATVYSKEGIEFFSRYKNIERVVLARELSLNEIEEIVEKTDKEIEVFIHGALCVCYSGQCKLSSQIGARSGNRGKCAQPCRLPYRLIGNNVNLNENYYLSTKDICTVDILPDLVKAGVHSLKIEGRMKSPEYVTAVTRIYRKYLDKCFENEEYVVENEDKDILLQVFNRGGFSKGYLENKDSKNIWCNDKPKHKGTYLGKIIEYDDKKNNITLRLAQDLSIGDVIEVSNKELSSAKVSFIRSKKERVKISKKGDIVIVGDIKGRILKGQDVYKITSKVLNDELKKYYENKSLKKSPIDICIKLNINEKPEIKTQTEILGNKYEISIKDGIECEKGIRKVLTKEDVIKQMSKTGDVPFVLNNIDIEMDNDIMTTMSNLNNIRRLAVEELSQKIVESFKHEKLNIKETKNNGKSIENLNKETKISIYVYDLDNISNLNTLNKADRVYISLKDVVNNKEKILSKIDKNKICIYLPTITSKRYKEYLYKNIELIKEIKNILITNVEHLEIFRNMNLNIYLDNSFNIFNSKALDAISENNIKGINISNELTLEQIKNIETQNAKEIEIDVYGNLQVMYSNFCVLRATDNCKKYSGKYELKDRKNKEFPILFDNIQCNSKILNSDKLFSEEAINQLNTKVDYMRLYIYDENQEQIENVINTVKQLLNNQYVKNKIESNELQKYTNGHFFREV